MDRPTFRILERCMTREMVGLDPTLRAGKFETKTPAVRPRPAFERHYSGEELAKMWRVSDEFVRRLFLREPGVVIFWRSSLESAFTGH